MGDGGVAATMSENVPMYGLRSSPSLVPRPSSLVPPPPSPIPHPPSIIPLYRLRFLPPRLRGTFAPFFLASERPIAIACLRLFTVLPLRPDLRVPFLRRRIALSTRFDAALPYLLLPEDFFAA